MKNIINLTMIYFKQSLSQLYRSKKRTSALANTFLIIAIFIIVAFAMGYAYYGTALQFQPIGHPEYVLVLGLMFAAFIVLMMTMYDAQNQYYKNKDYDLLASLPIKTPSIITAKYLSSYFISLVYGFMIAFPAFIVYFLFCPITVEAVIYCIIAIFFLPTFTQIIGAALAFIISAVTYKLKNKKIVNTILTIVLTVGLIAFITVVNSGLMQDLFANGIPLWLKIAFSHIYFLFEAMTTGSFISFLIFLAITLAFALLSIGIITLGYKKINSGFSSTNSKKQSKKTLVFKKSSTYIALIKKETKTFFSSPVYLINSIIGPIMVIVLAISMGIGARNMADAIGSSFPAEFFVTIYVCFSSMCLGIGVPTSASISIEGQKLYILKSLPIPVTTIFNAKLSFNLFLTLPFVIVGSIIFIVITGCSFSLAILAILIPCISTIAFAGLGLLCNLKWPKLNWTSESQAVKQSLSLFISMLSAILISLIPFLIFFTLPNEILSVMSLEAYYSIYLAFITLLCIVFYSLLYTHGKKLYKKI